jgi:hypothetical protein
MLPDKSQFGLEIAEVLDMELIEQQLNNNSFDILKCLTYVTSKMLQLCAPIRDAAIKDIQTETDLTRAFERILKMLEEMKFDLMNFQLQSVKPTLIQQAVEYEKSKFDEALAQKQISLDKTKAWLKKSVSELQNISAARNPDKVEHPDLKVKYESAYHDALLSLVFSTTPLDSDQFAETLMMDLERIMSMQNETQALAIVSALLMLSKNIVPELRLSEELLVELKNKLLVLLEASDTSVEHLSMLIQTIAEKQLINKKKGVLSEEQKTLITSMVDKTLHFNDPVYSLISRRMQANIKHQLEKGLFKKESLSSHGLDLVATELESLSKRIYVLADHNKKVYAHHYDVILSELI